MAVLISLWSFFGNYTVILAAVISLLLWVLLSTPGKTCPFGNHLPRPAPDLVTKALAAETEVPTDKSPTKKKCSKNKKCSGKGCSSKTNIEEKMLKIYYSADSQVSGLAEKLDAVVKPAGFECSLISLENRFDADEVLSDRRGAHVFILKGEKNWFDEWLFDPEKKVKTHLTDLKFAVLAVGSENNKNCQEWDRRLWRLGGLRLKKVETVDNENDLDIWMEQFMTVLSGESKKKCCGTNEDKACSSDSSCGSDSDDASPKPVVDVEDLLLPPKK